MNMKTVSAAAAAVALVGCCSYCGGSAEQVADEKPKCGFFDEGDPVVGNWGMKLPYEEMSAGHMIVSRGEDGAPRALVLWRWAHPVPAKSCEIDGTDFRVVIGHGGGIEFAGRVEGNSFFGKARRLKDGSELGDVYGWRNPPVCPRASTKDAKFGRPIDLLARGLDGWKAMDPDAKFGWSMSVENGERILSNKLGLKPDGSWAGGGTNLATDRSDFFDFNLEYDVRVPKGSNSGVYLRGRYECQVVDSYGKEPGYLNMAAIYGRLVPSKAAEKAPGEWQHVSVTLFRRHVTVVLNGETIIDDEPLLGVTGGAIDADERAMGPIYLQGDHSDADYKNMILRKAVN